MPINSIQLVFLFTLILGLSVLFSACEDDGNVRELEKPYVCTFLNDAVPSGNWPADGQPTGCFEYDDSVTEADARADCNEHKMGGVIDVSGEAFGGGGCDTTLFSGYCVDPDAQEPGKEYTGPNKNFVDDLLGDCDETNTDQFASAAACVAFAAGEFTCIVD